MPYYMRAVVTENPDRHCYTVTVLWDDEDPDAMVCQTDAGSIPHGYHDPDQVYLSDDEFDEALVSMGFRVVGGNDTTRIVARAGGVHGFFDPVTREWRATPPPVERTVNGPSVPRGRPWHDVAQDVPMCSVVIGVIHASRRGDRDRFGNRFGQQVGPGTWEALCAAKAGPDQRRCTGHAERGVTVRQHAYWDHEPQRWQWQVGGT